MEMTVERGRVFVSSDKIEAPDVVNGVIPIQTIFAPIYRVNYEVKAPRFGQITAYDTLTINVWSYGGISTEGATSTAARIMNEHLSLFMELINKVNSDDILVEKEYTAKDKILKMLIEGLNLSFRPYSCLKRAGVNTLEELTQKTEEDMIKMHKLGKKSLEKIKLKITDLGLAFRCRGVVEERLMPRK